MRLQKGQRRRFGYKREASETRVFRRLSFFIRYLKKSSMGTSSTLDRPYNSISVTVRLQSSILETEPRQMYIARVSNRSDSCCWLSFFSFRSFLTFSPMIFFCVPSIILAMESPFRVAVRMPLLFVRHCFAGGSALQCTNLNAILFFVEYCPVLGQYLSRIDSICLCP